MLKIYRKIGGHNGSGLLSIGAGASQGSEFSIIVAIDNRITYTFMQIIIGEMII